MKLNHAIKLIELRKDIKRQRSELAFTIGFFYVAIAFAIAGVLWLLMPYMLALPLAVVVVFVADGFISKSSAVKKAEERVEDWKYYSHADSRAEESIRDLLLIQKSSIYSNASILISVRKLLSLRAEYKAILNEAAE